MNITRLIHSIKRWVATISFPFLCAACSGTDPEITEKSTAKQHNSSPISVLDLSSDDPTVLGQLSHLLETVRDAKNHDKPLTDEERSEINDLLAKVKSLQNDPEAMRQIEVLKSNLTGLKGIDKSQVNFDTQLLKP